MQREQMQLQARLEGNRRTQELQLEEIKNKDGAVIAHIDHDTDIDRLFIKIHCDPNPSEKYVCFLDSKWTDRIYFIKDKIEMHPDIKHMTFQDLKVFYNGDELDDLDTLGEKGIDGDCILHAVDNINDAPKWVVKSSSELYHWRQQLLYLQPPKQRYLPTKTELNPMPGSSMKLEIRLGTGPNSWQEVKFQQ